VDAANFGRLKHFDADRPRTVDQQRIQTIPPDRAAEGMRAAVARREISGEQRKAAHPADP
jgi:hypothetical protein